MNTTPSGLDAGTLVYHRANPSVQWTVVKDVMSGVLLSGTASDGKTVEVVIPSYFLVKV